jgi:tetratricopeptide (TPR) repeat protein
VVEDGLKHYPGFITAMVVLGRAYDQLNQPTKARAILEGAIKLSPENLRAHRILIKIYAAQGLTQEALKSCHVILAINPKDEEAQSVQAALAVQEPEQARDTASPHKALAQERESMPILTSDADRSTASADSRQTTCDFQPETAASTESAVRHAGTIAQLESWLRSLERQRRDRPTSDISGRNL